MKSPFLTAGIAALSLFSWTGEAQMVMDHDVNDKMEKEDNSQTKVEQPPGTPIPSPEMDAAVMPTQQEIDARNQAARTALAQYVSGACASNPKICPEIREFAQDFREKLAGEIANGNIKLNTPEQFMERYQPLLNGKVNLERMENNRFATEAQILAAQKEFLTMVHGPYSEDPLHMFLMSEGKIDRQPLPDRAHYGQAMVDADPNRPEFRLFNGQNLLAQGNASGALEEANQALKLGGGSAGAFGLRAAANFNIGNFQKAYDDAISALKLDPSDKSAFATMKLAEGRGARPGGLEGQAAGKTGDNGSSGGDSGSSAAASLFPQLPPGAAQSGHLAREAESKYRMRDFDAAQKLAERALSAYPENPQARYIQASLDILNHRYADAASKAAAGLKFAPSNKALLKAWAFSAVRSKDARGAREAADRLLEADPRSAEALAYRAAAQGLSGDRDGMLATLRRAATLDPRYEASLQSALQMPEDSDLLFLFPGEDAPKVLSLETAGRAGGIGVLALGSLVGGLLIGLGLLSLVMGPMVARMKSVFTRITSRHPAVTAMRRDDRPEPAAAGPGFLRGQYKLKQQIGAGGMGLVFEGEDISLGRRVAIKKMRDEIRLDPRERQRFVGEAKLVAALHHANIVDIYAITEEGDDVYLVFEYVTGKTVHELLRAKGAFSYREALGIFRGMAAALDFAHGRKIIHRDLKPSNVMVDDEGYVKMMDFGIARAAKDAATKQSMTNTVMGTPPYMAPEQEQGVVRKESDVYALAVCLYEMLCGKLPFVGIGAGMLMNKVNMSYVPVSKMVSGLPVGLDQIFARAFQADPDKRYKSAKEMLAALNDLVPGTRPDIAPPTMPKLPGGQA